MGVISRHGTRRGGAQIAHHSTHVLQIVEEEDAFPLRAADGLGYPRHLLFLVSVARLMDNTA